MKYTLLKITTSVVYIAIVAGLFFFGDRLSPDDGKSGAGQEETYKDAFRFDPEELSYDGTGELDLLDGVTLEGYTARELEGMVFTRIRAGDSLSEKKVQYTAETEGGKVRSFRPLRLRNYSGPKIRIPNSLPEVTRNLAGNFGKLLMVKDGYVVDDGFGNDVRQYAEIVYEADDRESARIHYTISFENMFGDRDVAKADDVNFAYIENQRVITDSDFVANPGEIVALVGPSGEGKTTMIRLVLGLIRPEEGHVTIESGGKKVDANANTRHLFAYVPQTNAILTGTVAENLRMVNEDATDEELIEALKLACAWDFVSAKPSGLEAKVGERGGGFSAGQAQRLSIARAILAGAPILLLDEATSALDVTTERQVLRNIVQRQPNRTVIVTTHRPSVLNLCQRVYRVMETRVTELDEEEAGRMAMDF